jgi:hypothetical protein
MQFIVQDIVSSYIMEEATSILADHERFNLRGVQGGVEEVEGL